MKILWITDVHHPALSGEHYKRSGRAFREFISHIEHPSNHRPDLMVISGDLVNRGSARLDDLESFRGELESLRVPYLVCPGNHDLAPSRRFADMYPGMEDMEEVALDSTNFGRVFGTDGLRRALLPNAGNWRIVSFALRDGDPDGQLAWLEGILKQDGPVLVFAHYPVLRSRSGGYCAEWGYARIAEARERLAQILSNRTGTTIYCCGHQHINSVVTKGVLTQIVSGALGNSPYCFRWIDLVEDAAGFETIFLPGFDDWMTDAMNPDRSTDEEHPTAAEYHRGLQEEQHFVVAV